MPGSGIIYLWYLTPNLLYSLQGFAYGSSGKIYLWLLPIYYSYPYVDMPGSGTMYLVPVYPIRGYAWFW